MTQSEYNLRMVLGTDFSMFLWEQDSHVNETK